MAYTTANGVASTSPDPPDSSVQVVTDYYEGAQGASGARRDGVLRRAERRVAELAPPPDPKTDRYTRMARDTELAVFEFLFEQRPHLERETQLDASVTYAGEQGLLDLIRAEMGEFYVGPREVRPREDRGPKTVLHNVSDEPLW